MENGINLISIVVPALNEEKLLPSCLESLKNQDYSGQYEIIIADNGSTDNTVKIARSHGIRVVPCPEKRGVFYARQVGADAARGDIVVQADADTIYPRDWLRRIAGCFASHPEVVAVAGQFNYRDPPKWAKLEYSFRCLVNRLTAVLLGRPLLVSGATFAFRREPFLMADGYKGLSFAPDQYGVSGRLRRMGKIVYDPGVRVFTSSRRVKKPFSIILLEAFRNFRQWCAFLITCGIGAMQKSTSKSRSRRVIARVSIPSVCLIFFIVYGYFVPASPVFGKVYYKGSPSEKVIALTFDDGPNEPYTSEVLDILARYKVEATFFLVGKNVELYPDVARRMLAEGNVVGNHSYSHDANHALTQEGAKDLNLAQTAILMTLGISPHLYRPPHGKKTPWELQSVKKAGLIEVTWSVSAGELNGKSATELAQSIISKVDPGEIILLHDGYGTSHNTQQADKSVLVAALPQIIESLQDKGYRFVTVPELLNVPAYND